MSNLYAPQQRVSSPDQEFAPPSPASGLLPRSNELDIAPCHAIYLTVRIRSIRPDELDRFAAMSGSRNPEWVKEMLTQFWAQGRSSADSCFVAEPEVLGPEAGKPESLPAIGRVAFWWQQSRPADLLLFGLLLPWDEDYVAVGARLLDESLQVMQARGASSATCYFYAEFDDRVPERHRLMNELGFELVQDKLRYLWKDSGPVKTPDRLSFHNYDEVGRAAFLEAIRLVTRATLDREDQARVAKLGEEAAAQEYLDILSDWDEPRHEWWQIAKDKDGELVGLVVPQPLDEHEGAVNYIGVVPAQRGHGFVDDLLALGTALLQSNGFRKVVAEIDRLNQPMIAAAARAGYKRTGGLWAYRRELKDER